MLTALLPGLSPERLRPLVGGLPFKLDEQLVELYGWHNGTDGSAGVPGLMPGTILLSAQDGIDDYRQRVEVARTVATDESDELLALQIYHPSWFPVLIDAGGDPHVVLHGAEPQGSVRFIPSEEPDLRYQAAPSVAHVPRSNRRVLRKGRNPCRR